MTDEVSVGELVDQGTHDELMAQQGAYWRLYEAQARHAAAEDAEHEAHVLAHHVPKRLVLTNGNHGTSVAGAAAARGNNTTGVSGACPNCSVMLIRSVLSPSRD